MTATGAEYFRVVHNNQIKVCRICLQLGHVVRDCPEFTCFKCDKQGIIRESAGIEGMESTRVGYEGDQLLGSLLPSPEIVSQSKMTPSSGWDTAGVLPGASCGSLTEPSTSNFSGMHCNMQQMGLYEKFPSDTPILVEFKKYLVEHLEVPNCQQEVDNVSRMLRYMQPTGDRVNMDFLKKSTETKDYIVSLKRAKLLPATILNYIKNMIRFVQFLLTRDVDDQDFHIGCQAYITLLNTLRKPVSKAHSKVTCKTSYDRLCGGSEDNQ
ncbi:hypothetical protein Q5P01_000645 [Channa striata]|uniref:CCHC-type domain-containing protein n=1 Tax=Channa striata TaxID=64152 RepID=A0AA88LMC4_CHASR|nr:hypothetical protein Q5P01_000645 [Channa striata]